MYRFSRISSTAVLAMLIAQLGCPAFATTDRTWTYTYNDNGQILSSDGPRTSVDDTTRFTYDARGNLTAVTNPLGHITRMSDYNGHGQPGRVIDPNGSATLIIYDAVGRITSRRTPHPSGNSDLDAHFTFDYDEITHNLKGTANSAGIWESYDYDTAGRLFRIESSSAEMRFSHDRMGNILSSETWEREDGDGHDALVTRASQRFDELGRKIAVLGNNSQQYNTSYDRNGNVLSTWDAGGRTVIHSYDALDRMTSEYDQQGYPSTLTYDGRDNTQSVQDRRLLTTAYTYNGHDELIQTNSPDSGLTTYTYDGAGNLLTKTDAEGYASTYTYDALNRVTTINYPDDTTKNVTYHYDNAAQCEFCVGRLAQIIDDSGITQFSYDFLGRVASRTQLVALPNTTTLPLTTAFEHDIAGRLLSITNPNGARIDYEWGTPDSIENGEVELEPGDNIWSVRWTPRGFSQARTLANFIDFNPYGPLNFLRYGNGIELNRSFDLDGRLEAQTVTGIQSSEFHYDNRDLITGIEDKIDARRTELFTYDSIGRLQSASGFYGDITYTYDENGNRLQKLTSNIGGESEETFTYASDSNRLEQLQMETAAEVAETVFTYDQRGNLINEEVPGVRRLRINYGADNRMDSIAP